MRNPSMFGRIVAACVLALLGACATANWADSEVGSAAMLDDVSNGLSDRGDGAMYSPADDAGVDVRARVEQDFANADEDPPATPRVGGARKLVRTAEFTLEVPRVEDAIAGWIAIVTEFDGYVAQRDGATLVCRIPADRFDVVVERLRGCGRVRHESMQALDVTEQHRDLTIRLANAKAARDRLLALLERAEKVEDLLKIETELRRLTDEIEQMTAALQNLDERVAMSSLTVLFVASKPDPGSVPRRRASRFPWINQVGAEHVLRRF